MHGAPGTERIDKHVAARDPYVLILVSPALCCFVSLQPSSLREAARGQTPFSFYFYLNLNLVLSSPRAHGGPRRKQKPTTSLFSVDVVGFCSPSYLVCNDTHQVTWCVISNLRKLFLDCSECDPAPSHRRIPPWLAACAGRCCVCACLPTTSQARPRTTQPQTPLLSCSLLAAAARPRHRHRHTRRARSSSTCAARCGAALQARQRAPRRRRARAPLLAGRARRAAAAHLRALRGGRAGGRAVDRQHGPSVGAVPDGGHGGVVHGAAGGSGGGAAGASGGREAARPGEVRRGGGESGIGSG